MTEKIICCGFGGQGIMVMGKFLSNLALETGRFTTYFPAYGAEVRGGTAHCMVIISDEEIFSPFVELADTLIVMNGPSLTKFKKRIKDGGLMLLNKSLVNSKPEGDNLKLIEAPFTDIAIKLGNIKCANTVALGAYLSTKKIFTEEAISKVMDKMLSGLSKEIVEVNHKALREGMKYGKG
jgi:2-oxoglutarate ferredoxin oxidoreductase subunit gamma